ncbi:hypothetical protein HLBENOHH_02461 [Aeromonas dhakensis]|uniref:BppU family phage baseplate upper protein n=1 Tax=Aeromonas dhakensis TaxID=196024 RepID=UPI00366A5976
MRKFKTQDIKLEPTSIELTFNDTPVDVSMYTVSSHQLDDDHNYVEIKTEVIDAKKGIVMITPVVAGKYYVQVSKDGNTLTLQNGMVE